MPENTGISGPLSITNFEVVDGIWTREYAELQKRCMGVMQFMQEHPDIAAKVEVTRRGISSKLINFTE